MTLSDLFGHVNLMFMTAYVDVLVNFVYLAMQQSPTSVMRIIITLFPVTDLTVHLIFVSRMEN